VENLRTVNVKGKGQAQEEAVLQPIIKDTASFDLHLASSDLEVADTSDSDDGFQFCGFQTQCY
jgi:hypothetical protein